MKWTALILYVFLVACDSEGQSTFTNPVYRTDFADPTVVRGADGWFYAYGTNTSVGASFYNIQVAKSRDLVTWMLMGDALPKKPVWADKDFWAPHVLYDAKTKLYFLYYSGESPDEQTGKCLGVATSQYPTGPFVDSGKPLTCGEGFVNIDPMAYDDPVTGKKLLYWGSAFKPLKVQELSDDRLSFKAGTSPTDLIDAGKDADYSTLIEGSWIHRHDGYYYLYYSGDNCCGDNAHYAVMVARSQHAEGPFVRLGETRNDNQSTVLEKNDQWLAPGHNSVITDDSGQDWIVYHAVARDAALKDKGRIMLIDRINYKGGWPVIATGSPGVSPQTKPVIK